MEAVPGVVDADVSCTAGTAVVRVKPSIEAQTLIRAISDCGFDSTARN